MAEAEEVAPLVAEVIEGEEDFLAPSSFDELPLAEEETLFEDQAILPELADVKEDTADISRIPENPLAQNGLEPNEEPEGPDLRVENLEDQALSFTKDEARPPVEEAVASLPKDREVKPLSEFPEKREDEVAEKSMQLPKDREIAAVSEASLPKTIQTEKTIELPINSAPIIHALKKGEYYLQICALRKIETLEAEIAKNAKYPLVVHPEVQGEDPIYRLLIGPLDQGESGALLERFKRSGYRDAFVKKG